jgi:tRNA G37 N-methylase TrmD
MTDAPLRIDVVTIFPELFPGPLAASITGRAVERGLATLRRTTCAAGDWAVIGVSTTTPTAAARA